MKYWNKWFSVLEPLADNTERDAYNKGFDDAVAMLGDDLCEALDGALAEFKKKKHRKIVGRVLASLYSVLDEYEFREGDAREFAESRTTYWKATLSSNSISKEWDSLGN